MNRSCAQCRQRKVKCDKINPCSRCKRACLSCVFTDRPVIPRGRNGGRRKEARDWKVRLAKLEELVDTLQTGASLHASNGAQTPQSSVNNSSESSAAFTNHPDDGMSQFVGRPFWSVLSAEVEGLRDVLLQTSDDESDTSDHGDESQSYSNAQPQQFNFVLHGPYSFLTAPEILEHPPSHLRQHLYSVYHKNVDPMFKILHWPTIYKQMDEAARYSISGPQGPSIDALSFSIYYAAVMTQPENECQELFGRDKPAVLDRYRFATEVSLSKADFLNTNDITVLQAFTIFLLILRSHDSGQRAWSLIGLAVQLARGMGLHLPDDTSTFTPFQTEVRHRLWHQLCVLDVRAALDRGAKPVIADMDVDPPAPLNIEDADLSPTCQCLPVERLGITQCTLSILSQRGCVLVKRLNHDPGQGTADSMKMPEHDWGMRQQWVDEYREGFATEVLPYCDLTIPHHWLLKHIMDEIISVLMLMAVRPLCRQFKAPAPSVKGATVLELAISTLQLEHKLLESPMAERSRWYQWTHWYALAVALVELCGQTENSRCEKAWEAVEKTFDRYEKQIADSNKGKLWKPLKKLMKKAQSMRKVERSPMSGRSQQSSDPLTATATAPTTSKLATFSNFTADPSALGASTQDMQMVFDDPGWPPASYNGLISGPCSASMFAAPEIAWNNWETFINDFTDMETSGFFENKH